MEYPDLYRVMFGLEDAGAADETLHCLVRPIGRAKANGHFRNEVDPVEPAT